MYLPDFPKHQNEQFNKKIEERFSGVEISPDLYNLLFEFYLSGAKDSFEEVENLAKRINNNA